MLALRRMLTLVTITALVSTAPIEAWALAPDKLKPEDAQTQRDAALEEAEVVADGPQAAEQLRGRAEELGDPMLFLAASERLREHADSERDDELAREAADLARIALDIALYLADERRFEATDWRPVTREQAEQLAEQAEAAVEEAEQLAEEIVEERKAAEEAARRAAEAEAAEEGGKKKKKKQRDKREAQPGTGLIIGGSVALTVGVGGLAMLGAGLAIGSSRQREAESLDLPAEMDRLDELDRQGATANAITYAGIGVAVVGLATGVALIVVGSKQRKQEPVERTALRVGPWLDREGAGLSVAGRF